MFDFFDSGRELGTRFEAEIRRRLESEERLLKMSNLLEVPGLLGLKVELQLLDNCLVGRGRLPKTVDNFVKGL